uniref:Lipocalin/cytosolic fatty-acid binding domain-containing protein n=1 Tax=Phocoena sinus TaxID=42100 RepID=A0A8C9DXB7_PHOSS
IRGMNAGGNLGDTRAPWVGPPRVWPRRRVSYCLRSNLEPQGSPRMKKMGTVMVQQEGPHLALTSHELLCGGGEPGCEGVAPGKFKLPMESGGKEVTVVASDYETYSIMNAVFHKRGKAHSVLKLYSWMVEHDEKATDRFLVKAMEHGLSAVDVQLLSKDCERPGPRGRPLTCVNLLPQVVSSCPHSEAGAPSTRPSRHTWKRSLGSEGRWDCLGQTEQRSRQWAEP